MKVKIGRSGLGYRWEQNWRFEEREVKLQEKMGAVI